MAKIFKLQPNPTFDAKVLIPVPGDEPAEVVLTFKHKGKKALMAFYDSFSPVKPIIDAAGNITNAAEVEAAQRSEIDTTAEIVVGWKGFEAEFSRESLEELLDNYPGAHLAILIAYRTAIMEAKAGNSPK